MKLRQCFIFSIFAVLGSTPSVHAATFRVDDSASVPHEALTPMRWRSLAPGRSADNAVEGATLVTIRLNVLPWLNKAGKIYMVLPESSSNPIKVEWSSQGKLLAGRLVSGTRALVFDGAIRSAMIEDTIALRLETDGRRLSAPQRLQFHFEIDLE
jgi:hypothetical protein